MSQWEILKGPFFWLLFFTRPMLLWVIVVELKLLQNCSVDQDLYNRHDGLLLQRSCTIGKNFVSNPSGANNGWTKLCSKRSHEKRRIGRVGCSYSINLELPTALALAKLHRRITWLVLHCPTMTLIGMQVLLPQASQSTYMVSAWIIVCLLIKRTLMTCSWEEMISSLLHLFKHSLWPAHSRKMTKNLHQLLRASILEHKGRWIIHVNMKNITGRHGK